MRLDGPFRLREGQRGMREDPNHPCAHCRGILQYFPIEDVIKAHIKKDIATSVVDSFCVPVIERWNILSKRSKGKEGLKGSVGMEELRNSVLYPNIHCFAYRTTDDDKNTEFWHRCVNNARSNPAVIGVADHVIFFLPDSYFEELDALVANLGLSPVDFRDNNGIVLGIHRFSPMTTIWARSSLEKYAARGFMDPMQLVCLPAILVDDQNEPALQGLRDRMSEF